MAILTGINTKLRGSAGNWTFQRLKGQTVAKEKVERKAIPVRTLRTQTRRMRWRNLGNLYSAFKGTLHPSFEGKDPRTSDYNMFIQANIGSNPVYLTKNMAVQGGCVVAPYQITRGQIQSVMVEFDGSGVPGTDIALGTLNIGNSTTVKAFSDAIINNNRNWQNGDQLSIYIARQLLDANTGVPRVEIEPIEFTLNTSNNTTLLGDLIPVSLLSVADGSLALSGPVQGGVAVVHSRIVNGKTLVSTQFFVVNSPDLANYQTQAALDAAIESYGGINKDDFLTPDIDDTLAPSVNP